MSIIQTRKQSAGFAKSYGEPRSQSERDIEKRLKLLRQQVYGRSSEHSENKEPDSVGTETQEVRRSDTSEDLTYRYSDTPTSSGIPAHSESFRSDITYLRHDLVKITSFATVAFGVQIILFFLLRNNILKLPFGF